MPEDDVPMRSVTVASDTSCLVAGNNKVSSVPGIPSKDIVLYMFHLPGLRLRMEYAIRARAHRPSTTDKVPGAQQILATLPSSSQRQASRNMFSRQDRQNMEYGTSNSYTGQGSCRTSEMGVGYGFLCRFCIPRLSKFRSLC